MHHVVGSCVSATRKEKTIASSLSAVQNTDCHCSRVCPLRPLPSFSSSVHQNDLWFKQRFHLSGGSFRLETRACALAFVALMALCLRPTPSQIAAPQTAFAMGAASTADAGATCGAGRDDKPGWRFAPLPPGPRSKMLFTPAMHGSLFPKSLTPSVPPGNRRKRALPGDCFGQATGHAAGGPDGSCGHEGHDCRGPGQLGTRAWMQLSMFASAGGGPPGRLLWCRKQGAGQGHEVSRAKKPRCGESSGLCDLGEDARGWREILVPGCQPGEPRYAFELKVLGKHIRLVQERNQDKLVRVNPNPEEEDEFIIFGMFRATFSGSQ